MIYKTKGIVLETFKYRDNQSIVHILTEEFGKVSYLVYAPQSKRASIRQSNMQVLSILDMEVEHLPHRDLQRIKEARLSCINHGILSDPIKMSISFFIAEITDKCIYSSEKDTILFGFIKSCINELDSSSKNALFALKFLIDLSRYLGFYPADKEENEFINIGLYKSQQALLIRLLNKEEQFSHTERRQLMDSLLKYYKHHIPNMGNLNTIFVLESLFDV